MFITVPYGPWEYLSYDTYPHRAHIWEYDSHDLGDLFHGKKNCTVSVLAHGWAMGLSPFNTPNRGLDGAPVEVRVSRDILVPLETLKSLRHVKKDSYGRVQKAFFDVGAEGRAREHIDHILDDIARKHWPE